MQEVLLVIHLLLALTIVALVLLQRSSGGGLGIGGGGMGDFATARGAANALTKATMICAFAFFATSLALAVIAKMDTSRSGLLEKYDTPAPVSAPAIPDAANDAAVPEAPAAPENAAPVTPEPPVPSE